MRETLSLFSYWGGILLGVAAGRRFLLLCIYIKMLPERANHVHHDLRRRSVADSHLAAETSSSGEISNKLPGGC